MLAAVVDLADQLFYRSATCGAPTPRVSARCRAMRRLCVARRSDGAGEEPLH